MRKRGGPPLVVSFGLWGRFIDFNGPERINYKRIAERKCTKIYEAGKGHVEGEM